MYWEVLKRGIAVFRKGEAVANPAVWRTYGGLVVGLTDGLVVGIAEGFLLGNVVGKAVGTNVGRTDGETLGINVG